MNSINDTHKKKKSQKIPVKVYGKSVGVPEKNIGNSKLSGFIDMVKDVEREVKTDDSLVEPPRTHNYSKNNTKKNKIAPNTMHEDLQVEKKKVTIMWVGVIVVMLIIFSVWSATLHYSDFFRINDVSGQDATLGNLKSNMKDSYDEFSETMEALQDQLSAAQNNTDIGKDLENFVEQVDPDGSFRNDGETGADTSTDKSADGQQTDTSIQDTTKSDTSADILPEKGLVIE